MELDDMKMKWKEIDKELQETKLFNEQLIKRVITNKSTGEMDKIRSAEFFGLLFCCGLTVVFLLNYMRVPGTVAMVISYIISLTAIVTSALLCVYKLRYLSQIDFSSNSVTETAKKVKGFKLFMARERLWGIILSPIMLAAVYITITQWVDHKDMTQNIAHYIGTFALAVVLMIAGTLVIYRKLYFSKIASILKDLEEIEQFKKESQ